MKKLLVLIFAGLLPLSGIAQRNVILLIADDIGTDYFGFYADHGDTIAVPNLRKLLKKGVRFENAMSNPVCSATRTGMLTGRYSFRTGVGGIVGGLGGSGQITTSEITIPKLLQSFNPNIAKANIGLLKIKASTNFLNNNFI
jgi:arylsulfatase A-like enzyme